MMSLPEALPDRPEVLVDLADVRLTQLGDELVLPRVEGSPVPGFRLCRGSWPDEEQIRVPLGLHGVPPPSTAPGRTLARTDPGAARWYLYLAVKEWGHQNGWWDGTASAADRVLAAHALDVWRGWSHVDAELAGAAAWWLTLAEERSPVLQALASPPPDVATSVGRAVGCNVGGVPSADLVAVATLAPPTEPIARVRAAVWTWMAGDHQAGGELLSKAAPALNSGSPECSDNTKPADEGNEVHLSAQDNCNLWRRPLDRFITTMALDGSIHLDATDWRSPLALGLAACTRGEQPGCSVTGKSTDGRWSWWVVGECSPEFAECVGTVFRGSVPPSPTASVAVF